MVADARAGDSSISEIRSRNMSAIRGSGTSPELKGCSLQHLLRYRFRLHRRDLPGSPLSPAQEQNPGVRSWLFLASASGVQQHHVTENQSRFLSPEV